VITWPLETNRPPWCKLYYGLYLFEALILAIVFIIDPRKKRTDHEQS
jgi:hypothetical protein